MKKIVFALAGAALLTAALAGCSNSSDGGAGLALVGGATNGGATNGGTAAGGNNPGAQPGGGTTGGTPDVLINASNLVYIGEVTETVDSVEYKVKKYADVLVDNPYIYTYYKVYYLNGKVRRIYRFEHLIGCDMDYKYDEFVEHTCGVYATTTGIPNPYIFTYYENGKLESQINYSYGSFMGKFVYTYYDNGKIKEQTIYNSDGAVSQKTGYTYYDNGNTKERTTYNPDGAVTGYALYYENGNTKQSDSYTGTIKTYSNIYYENGKTKLSVNYNNGAISSISCLYESGYYKHYYDSYSGKFYTYPENKKLTSSSTNSSNYSSCEDYTPEQAAAKLEELKNN